MRRLALPGRPPRSTGLTGRTLALLSLGVVLIVCGVLLHLPDMTAMLTPGPGGPMEDPDPDPMPVSPPGGIDMQTPSDAAMHMWTPFMVSGMVLLVVGMVVSTYALLAGAPRPQLGAGVSVDAIEQGKIRPAHLLTFLAIFVALVEDIMKPLTLGFVLPGMRQEYGLSLAQASLLPLVALTGTAVGSIIWGILADRYGRRPAIMLATLLFMATAACGLMPSFQWNLVMCFLMGCSAGGLLPLAFTLVAEVTPRRYRGWTAVALGGAGGVGGYLVASAAAYYLEPIFGWRILWLIGLPGGLLLLALMPLIPESPLHLLRVGQRDAARAVFVRFGLQMKHEGRTPATEATNHHVGFEALFRGYPIITLVVVVTGLVWGFVNFGFLLMLPNQLRELGMSGEAASGLFTRSTLFSAPVLAVVVLIYAYWRGRRSLALAAAATGVAVAVIGLWSSGGVGGGSLFVALGMLVLALSATNAMLLPYAAEIYPTAMRAIGTGIAAAATKVGGIVGPPLMLLLLGFGGGLPFAATVLAALCLAATVLLLRYGTEPGSPGLEKEHTRPAPDRVAKE